MARIRNFASALSPQEVAALDPQLLLTNLGLNGSGEFIFTLTGPAGISCAIESTTNLVGWSVLTNLVNFPGEMNFALPRSQPVQFLRVRLE